MKSSTILLAISTILSVLLLTLGAARIIEKTQDLSAIIMLIIGIVLLVITHVYWLFIIRPRVNMLREARILNDLRKEIIGILNTPVNNIMTKDLITVREDSSVLEVMNIFVTNNAGSILVTNGKILRGIITERDILSQIKDKNLPKLQARDIMTRKPVTIPPKTIIGEAELIMVKNMVRKLPIADEDILSGILTMTDILKSYENFFNTHEFQTESIPLVQTYMKNEYVRIQSGTMVIGALKEFIKNKANAILVMDKTKLLGIITERDMLSEYMNKPHFLKTTTVQTLMKTNVIAAEKDTSIIDANKTMIKHNVRRLPVREGEEVIGLITQTEILEAFCYFFALITSDEGKNTLVG
ncbi:MAG: CBS domain-containing protein [Nanoarchaeota archaeon]